MHSVLLAFCYCVTEVVLVLFLCQTSELMLLMVETVITVCTDHDFYRAAAMQVRYSYERLSVCLSVKRMDCDKTKAPRKKVQLRLIGSRLLGFQ